MHPIQPNKNNSCLTIFKNENPNANHTISVPFSLPSDLIQHLFTFFHIFELRNLQQSCKAFHFYSRNEYIRVIRSNNKFIVDSIKQMCETENENFSLCQKVAKKELDLFEDRIKNEIDFNSSGELILKIFHNTFFCSEDGTSIFNHNDNKAITEILSKIYKTDNNNSSLIHYIYRSAHPSEQFAIHCIYDNFFDDNTFNSSDQFLNNRIKNYGYEKTLNLIILYVKDKDLRFQLYRSVISLGLQDLKLNKELTLPFIKELINQPFIQSLSFFKTSKLDLDSSSLINSQIINRLLNYSDSLIEEQMQHVYNSSQGKSNVDDLEKVTESFETYNDIQHMREIELLFDYLLPLFNDDFKVNECVIKFYEEKLDNDLSKNRNDSPISILSNFLREIPNFNLKIQFVEILNEKIGWSLTYKLEQELELHKLPKNLYTPITEMELRYLCEFNPEQVISVINDSEGLYEGFSKAVIEIFKEDPHFLNGIFSDDDSEIAIEAGLFILKLLESDHAFPAEILSIAKTSIKSTIFDLKNKVTDKILEQRLNAGADEFVKELEFSTRPDFQKDVLNLFEKYPDWISYNTNDVDENDLEMLYRCTFKLLSGSQKVNRNHIKRMIIDSVKSDRLKNIFQSEIE